MSNDQRLLGWLWLVMVGYGWLRLARRQTPANPSELQQTLANPTCLVNPMGHQQRISRLFLLHLWACVPFALLWLATTKDPAARKQFWIYASVIGSYLVVRTGFTFQRPQWQLTPLWTVLDIILIGWLIHWSGEPNSVLVLLYLLPIAITAASLRWRWTVCVALLCMVSFVLATWRSHVASNAPIASGVFRICFFLILASLVASLSREAAQLREMLALSHYRRLLAAEMHDGIQQYLVSITARLELARQLLKRDPARAAEMAVEQRHLVRQAADELRYLVRRLRAPQLERSGFLDALKQHIALMNERMTAAIDLEVSGKPQPLTPDAEHALLRVIQEALTNAEKHARAQHGHVLLRFADKSVECKIQDDGVGFDPATINGASEEGGHFGLLNMKQRAESAGGTLAIRSAVGEGTEVAVTIPVKRET